ncbi:multicopper oxidase family protein [Methylobacterium isbiliense]|jgi:FtsP/CotA-like multicopper oxidase with cupredoxin domain|uniref:Multicopper oxidase MmcO n=1 Tax=Methylobacterium isbiliense TaxID=315478 RepID=A0ABQ4S803_9HYPH|nr:multicopper oxidase family protein [Methylobacterium isbiliense]MDN3622228.1 multicopper oxidase family protein [Methylobacterium isbiliense]GJD98482.1 Multicopper oxidase MmcO [Methylobacterium isbiliense]
MPSTPPTRRALLAGAALALMPAARPPGARAQTPPPPEPRVLTAGPAAARLRPEPAPETPVWSFDGRSAPPVLRVRFGEPVRLRLDNRTDKPLSLHWHGVRNRNAMDGVGGVTQAPVQPGASFLYEFTPPDAGTALIRPLVIGGSSEPGGRGLAGLLVVEEAKPPVVDRDVPLVLQDWRLEPDGSLAPFGQVAFAASSGRLGNALTVNGRPVPESIEAAPGTRLRLRLANACNARATRIRFDGLKVWVAAVDGQPTDTFEPLRATLPFPPGTRYDVLLDVPAEGRGMVTALIAQGIPLAVVVPKGDPVPARPPVAPIGENRLLPPEIKLQNAVRRELTLAGGASLDKAKPDAPPSFSGDPTRIWTVNGAAGTAGAAPLFSVKRGSVVVLALTNQTAFPQFLHLHGHAFRLLHPLDDGWEPYWLDTFQLLEGRTARIAFQADNPGRWLISATALERFDTGLWTSFEVT